MTEEKLKAPHPQRPDYSYPDPRFDGETYVKDRDQKPLKTQLEAVAHVMSDHGWYTIAQLASQVRQLTNKAVTEASISARIRDLRKERFGGMAVDRRAANGHRLFEYRMVDSDDDGDPQGVLL